MPPAYPEITDLTPLTSLNWASRHQKQPPPNTADSSFCEDFDSFICANETVSQAAKQASNNKAEVIFIARDQKKGCCRDLIYSTLGLPVRDPFTTRTEHRACSTTRWAVLPT